MQDWAPPFLVGDQQTLQHSEVVVPNWLTEDFTELMNAQLGRYPPHQHLALAPPPLNAAENTTITTSLLTSEGGVEREGEWALWATCDGGP